MQIQDRRVADTGKDAFLIFDLSPLAAEHGDLLPSGLDTLLEGLWKATPKILAAPLSRHRISLVVCQCA